MKNVIFTFLTILFSVNLSFAQAKKDITGEWINADKDRKVKLEKTQDGTFTGKISWLKNPKDAEYKVGQVVVKNLVFKDGKFVDGKAFSPSNGGWVKATAELENENTLALTGYKFFLSKTRHYTRVQ